MSGLIILTPEDIALYREQFSQNDQKEALYALDVIEALGGDVTKAASMLAPKYNVVVSRAVPDILEELAKKSRNLVCNEKFIDHLENGLSSAAIGLLLTGQIPEALAALLVMYLNQKGIKKWCDSHSQE
ncbi:MAG: hypothetical protein F6K54_17595 [Okeania sp. SIO3B5]|uniref:hypothetical protein n=1 Tax=Okeania sp. SIO3B5 TaxID=2607811 RepID=UPI0013FE989A|nr:hypothetical protein [Okeania sp. SIO3B5]NEO54732.1 hypothetical protein [Okeania sp. SIO3B5]